ncbi:hypothetical protein MTCD1_00758 [Colwellia marinimaniae]|uniref:Uncharacterized protein n=1 Tax=Colwellia marinimaniae TaxID=1513592 RepID=A0ABQ0MS27_9GAMM|nr:hypothetical protein MTCD1_00758 [Colwellia marinimaniae]
MSITSSEESLFSKWNEISKYSRHPLKRNIADTHSKVELYVCGYCATSQKNIADTHSNEI